MAGGRGAAPLAAARGRRPGRGGRPPRGGAGGAPEAVESGPPSLRIFHSSHRFRTSATSLQREPLAEVGNSASRPSWKVA